MSIRWNQNFLRKWNAATLKISQLTFLGLVGFIFIGIVGCSGGGGAPSPNPNKRKVTKLIKEANELVLQANHELKMGNPSQAESNYNLARDVIKEAKRKARRSSAKSELRSLERTIIRKMSQVKDKKIEVAKEKQKKEAEEEEKKLAAKAAKKKDGGGAEDAAKKKEEEQAAKEKAAKLKLLGVSAADVAKKKDDGSAPPPAAGEKNASGATNVANEAPKPTKPSNPVTVLKIQTKENVALAFVLLYNKDDKRDRVIGRPDGIFKDQTNGELFRAMGAFEAKKFNINAKSIFDQPDGAGIVAGTHRVPAGGTLEIVLIGEPARREHLKKIVKFAAEIHYEGQDAAVYGTGP